MCHNAPGDVITTRRVIVVMRGLEDEGRIRPRDTPVIAATALITVFRDNYELVRARIVPLVIARAAASSSHARERAYFGGAQTRREREREREGEGKQMSRRDAGRRYTQLRVRRRRGACTRARATDVSKAADAVFVMLMFSLLTAQQRAAPLCAPHRCTEWRMGMHFVPQFPSPSLPKSVTRNTRSSFPRAELRSTSCVSSESAALSSLGWPVRSAFGNHRAAEIEPSRIHARRPAQSVRACSLAVDVTRVEGALRTSARGPLRSREKGS